MMRVFKAVLFDVKAVFDVNFQAAVSGGFHLRLVVLLSAEKYVLSDSCKYIYTNSCKYIYTNSCKYT